MGCAHSHQDSWTAGGLTESEVATIEVLSTGFACLSFCGSSFIILCYICFPSLRKFAFKLVLFLSVADCLSTIGDFASVGQKIQGGLPESCSACLFQAWMISIFDLASILWTASIAHCLWRAIRYHDLEVSRFERWYHLFCWGVPAVLAILPQIAGVYGLENGQCWILSSAPALMFLQFYIPLWLVIAFNISIFWGIYRNLRGFVQPTEQTQMRSPEESKLFWRLGLYPVVLVVCWIFGTAIRIHNSLTTDRRIFSLYVGHAILGHCQGFLNFCVYGMNGSVRNKLGSVCCGLLGCRGGEVRHAGDEVELTRSDSKEEAGEASVEDESSATVAV